MRQRFEYALAVCGQSDRRASAPLSRAAWHRLGQTVYLLHGAAAGRHAQSGPGVAGERPSGSMPEFSAENLPRWAASWLRSASFPDIPGRMSTAWWSMTASKTTNGPRARQGRIVSHRSLWRLGTLRFCAFAARPLDAFRDASAGQRLSRRLVQRYRSMHGNTPSSRTISCAGSCRR